jgi:hypothetical protein
MIEYELHLYKDKAVFFSKLVKYIDGNRFQITSISYEVIKQRDRLRELIKGFIFLKKQNKIDIKKFPVRIGICYEIRLFY